MSELKAAQLVRDVPDFPKPGIQFRDITTLLRDPSGLRDVTAAFVAHCRGRHIDLVAAVESRGFIIGAPLAQALGVGFVPVRKPGKLPGAKIGLDYQLEYGSDRIELNEDAIAHGASVLLVDDLIATGGTALAAAMLIEMAGGKIVDCLFVVDLPDLGGRQRLQASGYSSFALCEFEGD